MRLPFFKYQGAGNDFILVDNRDGFFNDLNQEQVHFLCDRNFGIGGDGLMLLNLKPGLDFKMVYYNSDGNVGSMCGNGGRCITRFANDIGINKSQYYFEASDGLHEAIIFDEIIKLKMGDVIRVQEIGNDFFLNTGSPHYVTFVEELAEIDVVNEGRKIRYNEEFREKGVNVNFIKRTSDHSISVRTYERGVENETLSCGTGITAAALVASDEKPGPQRMDVKTLGGELFIEFEKTGPQHYSNIWLCGPAQFVFKGEIEI